MLQTLKFASLIFFLWNVVCRHLKTVEKHSTRSGVHNSILLAGQKKFASSRAKTNYILKDV